MADLYDAAIVAEAKANHAAGRLDGPDVSVTCDNPLCGDRVTVDLKLADGGRVAAIAQHTRGCLLTQAAASLLGQRATGTDKAALSRLTGQVRGILAGEAIDPDWPELNMFAPVSEVRSRHDCVLLPFEALAEALDKAGS